MKRITTAVAAPLLLLAVQASAQTAEAPVGLYAGGALTQSTFDVGGFGVRGIDDTGDGWKALLGYRFSPRFGVESSFIYFGQATTPSVSGTRPFLAEARAIPAFGVGYLPLGPVDLFGKVGLALVDAQGNVGAAEFDERSVELAFGAGAQFRLSRFAIRAEYERFDTDAIGKLDLLSVGVTYTFGGN